MTVLRQALYQSRRIPRATAMLIEPFFAKKVKLVLVVAYPMRSIPRQMLLAVWKPLVIATCPILRSRMSHVRIRPWNCRPGCNA